MTKPTVTCIVMTSLNSEHDGLLLLASRVEQFASESAVLEALLGVHSGFYPV
jgi:hypothetical protein